MKKFFFVLFERKLYQPTKQSTDLGSVNTAYLGSFLMTVCCEGVLEVTRAKRRQFSFEVKACLLMPSV